jgi:hypothetical protein
MEQNDKKAVELLKVERKFELAVEKFNQNLPNIRHSVLSAAAELIDDGDSIIHVNISVDFDYASYKEVEDDEE